MARGIFITVEGMEGSGKTTHCEKISEYLEKKGFEVIRIHEPGGTRIGEQVRNILLSAGNEEMIDKTELFLFLASRSQLVEEVIKPAIAAGKIIVCDRYIDSTIAYQGYGRGVDEKFIRLLNKFVAGNVQPDLTIILDVDAPIGLKRARKRLGEKEPDRIEKGTLSFHQRVRQGYLSLSRTEHGRVRIVDAARAMKNIEISIKKHIDKFLEKLPKEE